MKTSDSKLKQRIMEAVDGHLTDQQVHELEQELQTHPNPEYLELYRHFRQAPSVAESYPDFEPSPFAGQRMVARLESMEQTYDTVQYVFKRFILAPMLAMLLLAVGLRFYNTQSLNQTTESASSDVYSWIELDNQTPYYQIPDYAILQEVSNEDADSGNPSSQ